MVAEPRTLITREEYLALERASEQKHEYIAGEMVAMVGGSPKHSQIAVNTSTTLNMQLRARPCIVYSSDLRVAIRTMDVYTYPDVTVVCGEPRFDSDGDGLLNPMVIVEVLSPGTEGYDRGRKFLRYQRIQSFREYVLISQDSPVVERFARQPDGQWLWSATENLDESVALLSIDCTLALADVYAKVVFERMPEAGEAGLRQSGE
jgi:Uma2 family endonuclease